MMGKTKRGRPKKYGTAATSFIHIRINPERKRAYERAARPGPLAEWIVNSCDAMASYSDSKKESQASEP